MISLYRPGNSHVIRGISCEMSKFPAAKLEQMKKEGWETSPEDCVVEQSVEKEIPVVQKRGPGRPPKQKDFDAA